MADHYQHSGNAYQQQQIPAQYGYPQQQQQQQQQQLPPPQPGFAPTAMPVYAPPGGAGYFAPPGAAPGPGMEDLALQQQMLALQVQTMQLQSSLEAKRAQRRRLLEQRRAEEQANAGGGGGTDQQELLQQVALQSMQLQTMMLKQMSQGGSAVGGGAMASATGLPAASQQPQQPQQPHVQSAPQSQPAAAVDAAEPPTTAAAGQGAAEPAVPAGEGTDTDASPLDNPPVTTMHQLRADDYDLDVIVPDVDIDEELGEYDALAELGVAPLEDPKAGSRSALRRLRAPVWALIFIHRTEKLAAAKSSYSAEQVAPLFEIQMKVCKAWVKHVASPHMASLAADHDLSLDCQAVPDGGFVREGDDGADVAGGEGAAGGAAGQQPAKRKFWSKSSDSRNKSADEEAFLKLRIRTRRVLDDLYQGFFGASGDGHPKPVPTELYKFMQHLVKDGMRFPARPGDAQDGADASENSPFLLPSEKDNLEFTSDGTTRHMDRFRARFVLLNFIVTKTLLPHLAGTAGTAAATGAAGAARAALTGKASRSIGKLVGKATFDNSKMIATVIYWVVRCGMIRDESTTTLHPGDPSVLEDLFPGYSHVLHELMRTGWLELQRNRMWEICDQIYEKALLLETR
jgi:hypothetical protein